MKVRVVNSVVWPVTVFVPVDGGKTDEEKFYAKLKRLSPEENQELSLEGDKNILREIVQSVGVDENNLSADKALLEEMFSVEYYRAGLFRAYQEFVGGVAVKN